MSFLTPYLLLLAPNRELVPGLEPEFTCPAVEEHATFAEAMHSLECYLEDVCGFEKNEMGHVVLAQGKQKAAFDAAKIKYLIEELCGPMFIHVGARTNSPPPLASWNLTSPLSLKQKSATSILQKCALLAFQLKNWKR